MKKLIILSLVINILIFNIQASTTDTLKDTTKASIQSQLIENLDSLSTLWYVQQSLKINNKPGNSSKGSTYNPPVISDSLYAERLANIPSIIDLPYNDRVKAFIKLYTDKRRNLAEVMLGLTEYYFPIFEEILDLHGMPLEFKYLTIIESALNPRAVSRAGATGIWQFMYATGKMYDLEINSFVDERRDPVESTYAAARFLKDLYNLYGDWTLALAAYNCGPGNVNKAIRRSNGKTDFWEIYYYLPRETRGYVPSFIAATYFMHYYAEHDLVPREIDLPIPCDTVMIDKNLHMMQVAEVLNIDIDLLRDINPQYRTDVIPGKSRPYPLKLPVKYITQFIDLEDSIYAYKDTIYFNPKVALIIPTKGKNNWTYVPPAPSKDKTAVYYTVKTGDNLGFISEWYNVRIADLKYWNNVRGNMIRAGQKLIVYVPKSKLSRYKKVNTMSFAQKQKSIGATVTKNPEQENTTITETTYTGKYSYYTVRQGDNPWLIAKKYPGVSAQNIIDINNISDTKGIKPGQKLKIPKY